MLYSVRGKLIQLEAGMAVVECGGVGFLLKTTNNTLAKLPPLSSEVLLYTYLNVREDLIELFGFADMGELNCFKMLITVTGVGPKAALSILSELTPERFALCVATGDTKSITQAQGVGPKLASRIILELKDKVQNDQIAAGISEGDIPQAAALGSANVKEAISALVVLGYPQSQAAQAVSKLDPALSVEEMIRLTLKNLAAR